MSISVRIFWSTVNFSPISFTQKMKIDFLPTEVINQAFKKYVHKYAYRSIHDCVS